MLSIPRNLPRPLPKWEPLSWAPPTVNDISARPKLRVKHLAASGLIWTVSIDQYHTGIRRLGASLPGYLRVSLIQVEKDEEVIYAGHNRYIPVVLMELAESGIYGGYKVYIRQQGDWALHEPPSEFMRAINGACTYEVQDYPSPSYLNKCEPIGRKDKAKARKDVTPELVATLLEIIGYNSDTLPGLVPYKHLLDRLFNGADWRAYVFMGRERRRQEELTFAVHRPKPQEPAQKPLEPLPIETWNPPTDSAPEPVSAPIPAPAPAPAKTPATPPDLIELANTTRERDRLLESTDPATIDIQAQARKQHEEEARQAAAAAEALLAAYTPPSKQSDLEDIEDNFGLDEPEHETSKDSEAKIKARRDLANKLIEERNFPKEFLENYENNRFKRRAPTPPATTWYEMGYMTHQHQLEHLIKTYPDTYEEHLKFTEDNKYLVGYDPASVLKRIAEERAISKAKAEEENKKRIAYEAERDERRKRLGIQNILD